MKKYIIEFDTPNKGFIDKFIEVFNKENLICIPMGVIKITEIDFKNTKIKKENK